jgi:hypothetical protein
MQNIQFCGFFGLVKLWDFSGCNKFSVYWDLKIF